MDAATRIPPATEPALSARSELPKNSINIDKFTGFFDKKTYEKKLVTYCNIKRFDKNMSPFDLNMTAKIFRVAHLPAYAMS